MFACMQTVDSHRTVWDGLQIQAIFSGTLSGRLGRLSGMELSSPATVT